MKSGNNRLVVQPRDNTLLQNLATLLIADRDQLKAISGFGSNTRINVRLSKLRAAGLICRYFVSSSTGSRRSIYALSAKGAALIGTLATIPRWKPDSIVIGNAFAAHQLFLADLYIVACKTRADASWRIFNDPPVSPIPLIPDAQIETGDQTFLLEADLGTEGLRTWSKKAENYIRLAVSGEFKKITSKNKFSVLVVATSETRMDALRKQISKQTQKLFWFSTIEIIKRQGFWSACWLRASGDIASLPGE